MLQIIIFVLTNMIQTVESNQSYQFYLVRWQMCEIIINHFLYWYLFRYYVWQFHVLVPIHMLCLAISCISTNSHMFKKFNHYNVGYSYEFDCVYMESKSLLTN